MKATYLEFNDDATKIKKTKLDINFASNDTPPVIEVILPPIGKGKIKTYRTLHIPAKDLVALIFGKVIDQLNK